MGHEHEFLVMLVGLIIGAFFHTNHQQVKNIPNWVMFSFAYHALLAGLVLSVLEEYFLPVILNLAEHISYAASSLLLAVWIMRMINGEKDRLGKRDTL